MSDEILNVGIAGYGTVGKIRHRFADKHANLRVIAVCDQTFDPPLTTPEGVRCWSNYQELLSEPLDVLFVCVPNYLAPEVTIAGLERGLHVFCEKPPGRDLADIGMVIECEREHPRQKLMYGFNHRYHHSVRDALRIVNSGELGEIINMRGVYGKSKIIRFDSDWRTKRVFSGGGILLDQGIHMVDMMRLFAGDEFTEIHSSISNSYWGHDVEDNAYAMMRTAGGVVAMLHSSATSWRHRFHLDLTMTRGAIVLSGILSSTRSYGAETITVVSPGEDDGGDPREQMTRYSEDTSWRDEISDFADAVLNDKPIVYGSSREALKTMQLVFDIYCADPEWSRRYQIQNEMPVTVNE
jgi:predicted dehydrogenase